MTGVGHLKPRNGSFRRRSRKTSFPPIDVLREAGVLVFSGSDNVRDAWWPYGDADMIERAMIVGYCSGFYTDEEIRFAFDWCRSTVALL
jgi:cytosine/adenosine deaminase-related metal-dependent hydrolase